MPFYQRLGDLPRKRHVQFRENGTLLTEEVMGLEGFTGNESILYHLQSPCRVMELGGFEPIEREEWVPDQHAHCRFKPGRPQRYPVSETPGVTEMPRRSRTQYGQLVEGAPYYHRDLHPPAELHTVRERGEYPVKVRVRGGYQTYVVDYHPFDVVGWDGYLYPWTFSIHDFEPITGRIHQPPPSHQTFQGRNFVICSFCPRKLDFDPLAVPIPYHHSNLQSEEMIYYVSGNFGSRRGVDVGSITLHPSGLPHGPQPGLAEKSIGLHETTELAVMCDTFHPLKLTKLAKKLDDGKYAYSWYENAEDGSGEAASVDGDASGAGLTSHF